MNLGLKKFAVAMAAAGAMISGAAQAATVWTNWTSATTGASGSVTGTLNGVGVTFAGQVLPETIINGSFDGWSPASTFVGGSVESAPNTGDFIAIQGGAGTGTQTITFSSPITNPILSIVSLGRPSLTATFNFISATPIFQAGGASSTWGGSAVSVSGNTVSGSEGSGSVMFLGTFTTISWTMPVGEFFTGFTVGAMDTNAVPVPGAIVLLMTGLAGLGFASRRKAA
jgi:hypothetical protein